MGRDDEDALDTLDDLEGQAPALVIDCAPLLARVVELVGRDGVVYRLRDDVPTQRLLWAFNLLDIEQTIKDATTWEAREAALDERERELLNLATTIVRHSYPALTRTQIQQRFTPEQMQELIGYFFMTRLLPLLEQRRASAASEPSVEQTEQTEPTETPAPAEPTATSTATAARKAPPARRAASAGVTPSRKR